MSAPDHTYQFQYVYTLAIRKYWDVPGTINKRSWSYISISTCPLARESIEICQVRLISVLAAISTCLQVRNKKVWDVASTINKRSYPCLAILSCHARRNNYSENNGRPFCYKRYVFVAWTTLNCEQSDYFSLQSYPRRKPCTQATKPRTTKGGLLDRPWFN